MPWLVSDTRVLASVEVARTRRDRRRGLLGRDHLEGGLIIEHCAWVHTIGMRFALDVAHVDARGTVLRTTRMAPHRIGIPVRRATTVIEAEAGAFARWGLAAGTVVEVRDDAH